MSERVFITGFGIITAVGKNGEENYQSLLNRKHGFAEIEILETIHKKSLPSCEVKLHDKELRELLKTDVRGFTRTTLLGLLALREAIASAALSRANLRSAGLISSTTTGGIREFERYFHENLDLSKHGDFEQFTDTANPGEHCERLAEEIGVRNYIGTLSTACSSSANAIINGAALIRNKKLDIAICGGTEALSKFTINGFNSLMILDPEHCRPFDETRKGLNLGEGAAFLVLESEASVEKNNKKPIAVLSGYGNANDAFHQTASSPEGKGAWEAMRSALAVAKTLPSSVDYVNAHGTATENNDLSEGTGLKRLFGENLPPFSSTKPYTGHTLAAAGSIEAVYSVMSIQHNVIWPSLNFRSPIPDLSIEPARDLIRTQVKRVLSNSFGFGGNTSSLLFESV
ncbi:MAG: beta-ketoacyl-[acyl-carrier-protein] synthase family protein [Chryseolinea sp.]